MYCNNCGNQTNDEDIFCANCGAKIINNIGDKQQDSNNDKKGVRTTLKRMIAIVTIIVILVFIIVSAILFTNKQSTVPLANKPKFNYNSKCFYEV